MGGLRFYVRRGGFLAAAAILALSPKAYSGERSNPSKTILLFVASDIQPILSDPSFLRWQDQLGKEGFKLDSQIVENTEAPTNYYTDRLKQGNYIGSILMGKLALPKIVISSYVTDFYYGKSGQITRKQHKAVMEYQSLLPLMNPVETFPENGSTTWLKPKYFKRLSQWSAILGAGGNQSPDEQMKQLEEYFDRNVAYRTCRKSSHLAVAGFIDDDWDHWYSTLKSYRSLSEDWKMISALSDFEKITQSPLDFVQISAHSNPTEHADFGSNWKEISTLTTSDIQRIKPKVKFYNLFACGAGTRVTEPNLAETYLFSGDETLGVIASTKTGGAVENPTSLYRDLKEGRNFGESILKYQRNALQDRPFKDQSWAVGFNAGVAFFGDPTLNLHACE